MYLPPGGKTSRSMMFNSFYPSLAVKFFIGAQLMHDRTGKSMCLLEFCFSCGNFFNHRAKA
jgi:hypothetical protein